MSKIKFRDIKLSKANRERLDVINNIIEEYQNQGYILTLRQLYYQLVSRDVIPNKVAEYAKLWKLLKEWRMSGIVDWGAIEDRLRHPSLPYSVEGIQDAMNDTIDQYRLNRMSGQDVYIEVWVEKDALSWVLKRVTEKYHIPIVVNRWYSSVSAMFDAYMRFLSAHRNRDQKVRIIYLWDYDPSGIDMIRDIRDRTLEFERDGGMDFEIIPIALTRKQIDTYDPPPNPAKMSDPRAKWFVFENWATSWEVDALKPEILNQILTDNIKALIDEETYEDTLLSERNDKKKLREMLDSFNS